MPHPPATLRTPVLDCGSGFVFYGWLTFAFRYCVLPMPGLSGPRTYTVRTLISIIEYFASNQILAGHSPTTL
jgi:hypothetical protein